jgi:hypothetical protein
MHQLYDIQMAHALAADRRAEFRRAVAGQGRHSQRRPRLGRRGRRAGPGAST